MLRALPSHRLISLTAVVFAFAAIVDAAEPAAAPADAPWKIHQTVPASFPFRLMRGGFTHGEARVRVSVGADGELLDALMIACTHRDFGEEALQAVRRWRYEPERVKGEPIGVVTEIAFSFEVSGVVAIEKRTPSSRDDEFTPPDPYAYRAEPLKRLDRIPTPTQVVPPVYPKVWSDAGLTGTVTVDFYIDESGRARIPVVIGETDRHLASSAIAAVGQWRFEPPTCRGQPVLVHAQQIFSFQPGKN